MNSQMVSLVILITVFVLAILIYLIALKLRVKNKRTVEFDPPKSINNPTVIEQRQEVKEEYKHKSKYSKQYHPMMSCKGGYEEWKANSESVIERVYSIERIQQEIAAELTRKNPDRIVLSTLKEKLFLRTGKRVNPRVG